MKPLNIFQIILTLDFVLRNTDNSCGISMGTDYAPLVADLSFVLGIICLIIPFLCDRRAGIYLTSSMSLEQKGLNERR